VRAEVTTDNGAEIELYWDGVSPRLNVSSYSPAFDDGFWFDLTPANLDDLISALTMMRDARPR